MAHLWLRCSENDWAVLMLEPRGLDLTTSPPRCLNSTAEVVSDAACQLVASAAGWSLLVAPRCEVRVNGEAVPTGLRLVEDRDEIRVGREGVRAYFSTELLACVEPLPGGDRELFCGRCKQAIAEGADSVRCPACGVWHHQDEELPCWLYAEACSLCDQPTVLDGQFRWTPEGL